MARSNNMINPTDAPRRGGSSTRRRLEMEDDIIRIPDCDINAVSERFKLTLIGRMFNLEGRSVWMPSLACCPRQRFGMLKAEYEASIWETDVSSSILIRS